VTESDEEDGPRDETVAEGGTFEALSSAPINEQNYEGRVDRDHTLTLVLRGQ
jgi:hypothetical protein